MLRCCKFLVKAVLVGCIVGGATQALNAGNGPASLARQPHRMQSVDDQVRRLNARLHLTAEQQAGVRTILNRRRAEILQLRAAPPPSAMDRFTKQQAVTRAAVDQIGALLTDEQRKIFVAPRQRPGDTGPPEDAHPPDGPPAAADPPADH